MLFEEYLTSKKIDALSFQKNDPETFGAWKKLFEQMHPASFTSRFLFKINGVRRTFQLRNEAPSAAAAPAPAKSKPVIRPKIS